LVFVVAAAANLQALLSKLFWKPFNTTGAIFSIYGGLSTGYQTRVCACDRAGYGWSDPGPQPRTPSQIAEELHALLIKAGVQGAYVLVRHSAAGKQVRLYVHRYPHDVVGMALIDARHESVDTNRSPRAQAASMCKRHYQRMIWVAARIGLVRPFSASVWPKVFPATQNFTATTPAEIGVLQTRPQHVKTVLPRTLYSATTMAS
jgi:pimeloyl-ACP methyl ester carboxylesterase